MDTLSSIRDAKLLIIDDQASNTKLLYDILRMHGYRNFECVNDPRGVLSLIIEYEPDLILLDLMMPYVDGFQILEFLNPLNGHNPYLPVIIVSSESSFEARQRALSSGAIDYLIRPFVPEEVNLRVGNLLMIRAQQLQLAGEKQDLEVAIVERTHKLEDYELELKVAQLEVADRLAKAAEHRDDNTGQHTRRVGLTSSLIAQAMNLPETQVELLRRAAPLHDVGKIGIPDSVLLKPGAYTAAERAVMMRHCKIGADLLAGGQSQIVQTAERIAISHHEKWDGSGYPQKLQGTEIPLEGRILAVADVFDALTHARPYKLAWPVEDAVQEILRGSGKHFDPEVVEAFMTLPHQRLV